VSKRLQRVEEEVRAAREGKSSPDPTRSTESPVARPLAGVTIAVDPGHNGGNATHPEEIAKQVPAGAGRVTKPCNTTGTETNDGVLTEAEFNFEVAQDLRRDLVARGAKVVMTRTSNDGVGPCVNERAQIANESGAALSLSIHADGNLSPGARGFDVIHPKPDEMIDPSLAKPSLFLAESVRDALARAGIPTANYVGREGLDARDDLAGLNLSRVPAALVELGNMRSAEEVPKLESASYRARLAAAIADGLTIFLEEAQI
jgi:N-acetylmuramoyl-L-alanine amidase